MNFYTNVIKYGNQILYRGIENGRRVKKRIKFSPNLYVPVNKETKYKTLEGNFLEKRTFDKMSDASEFVKNFEEVSNMKIYGNTSYVYSFIHDYFKDDIEFDKKYIFIDYLDIEVDSEHGFPDPELAERPITAISIIRQDGHKIAFGCGKYVPKEDEKYVQCRDEIQLISTFLEYWKYNCPDILTGWNIVGFDIPYIINRITNLVGDSNVSELSPWGIVRVRDSFNTITGKPEKQYNIYGVEVLDYIDIYKKFAKDGTSRESYTLNHIASVELGEEKVDYTEYDDLHDLYKNNYQKFIEYNIRDSYLVLMLEEKLRLIDLVITMAYDSKTLYTNTFKQTIMIDSIIYGYLLSKNIIVPPREFEDKEGAFKGAFVKEPQEGLHNWIFSFDLDALYPNIIIQYNISPETLIDPSQYTDEMRKIISDGISVEKLLNGEVDLSGLKNCTVTPNGQFYRTDKQGFIPEILEKLNEDRNRYKKLMLENKKGFENSTSLDEKEKYDNLVSRYNNFQLAKKRNSNSFYGAMGTPYFRFFDIRLALSITQAGMLSILWVERDINKFLNNITKKDKDYVVAMDTDSLIVSIDDIVKLKGFDKEEVFKVIDFMDNFCEEEIQPVIDRSYDNLGNYLNVFKKTMRMKREVLANKGFWTAKKRYVINVFDNEGVRYHEPELKIMGLDMIKSSTPMYIRDKMKEVVKLMMNEDEEVIQKYISKIKEEFKKLEPEHISFPRSVNGLEKYHDSVNIFRKGTPIHVKGSLLYNKFLKDNNLTEKYKEIKEGEKIKFTYLKLPNPLKTPVISFPSRIPEELGLEKYVDYETQFDKTFLKPIEVILGCVGWEANKKSTLDKFFG